MRIGRTLPPAAASVGLTGILSGVRGLLRGDVEVERFGDELKQHFGAKHCFLVSSGKAAFTLILWALKELSPDRNEVLIPAFTCYSVPSCVVRARLKIRLCDLNPDGLDFDFAQLSEALSTAGARQQAGVAIADDAANMPDRGPDFSGQPSDSSSRLLAVVPTHLFGIPSNVPRLRAMLQDPGVTIVEDAAQAMGETRDGRKLGSLGDVSFFSLARGKAFSTVEGGIILTNRDDIAEVLSRRVGSLPGYGFGELAGLIAKAAALMLFTHPWLFWIPRSMRFLRLGQTLWEAHFPILRMSSFQAGMATNWRERLQSIRDARKANVKRWMEILGETGNRGTCFQALPESLGLLRFPIRVRDDEKRNALLHESASKGAGVMSVYPASINRLPQLQGEIPAQACPVADSCARELVTLPTHDFLTEKDVTVLRQMLARAFALEGSECP
jgi:perosamine synthetase